MKKLAIICLFIIIAQWSKANTSEYFTACSDTVVTYLKQLDLYSFKYKPMDTLIVKLPQSYISMKVRGAWRTEHADVLVIEYPNEVVVEIYALHTTYINPENPNKLPPDQVWSPALMRKENISYVKIWDRSECINGCENR